MLYYENIFKELNQRKIKYLIIGGMAVNLYGSPRVTADLDILLSFDVSNVEKCNAPH